MTFTSKPSFIILSPLCGYIFYPDKQKTDSYIHNQNQKNPILERLNPTIMQRD